VSSQGKYCPVSNGPEFSAPKIIVQSEAQYCMDRTVEKPGELKDPVEGRFEPVANNGVRYRI
jgi:hypothetical protein